MDKKRAIEVLRGKLKDVHLSELSIGDLAGITLVELLQKDDGGGTFEGECEVLLVDDEEPPEGWVCRCFTNRGITTYSFMGPEFGGWVMGGDGGFGPGRKPRFTVVNPKTGQAFFVVVSCSRVI